MSSIDSAQSTSSIESLPLVVGIGSPHGDDQAGWAAADALATIACEHAVIRKAAVPVDLLNWLDHVEELHIVDVCQVEGNLQMLQPVYRWDWSVLPAAAGSTANDADDTTHAGSCIDTAEPAQQTPPESTAGLQAATPQHPDAKLAVTASAQAPTDSSHGFDVLSVLQLARQLGSLPETVILWAIPGTCFDAAAELSPQIRQWLPRIVQQIATELHDA